VFVSDFNLIRNVADIASRQKYGHGNSFFIDAAGRKIHLLLDPMQIKRVMNASKELDPNPFIHDMILRQMLRSPKETIDFYRNDHGKMDMWRWHTSGSTSRDPD
jgi:hypothetical protein